MNDATAGDRRTFMKMVAGGALGAGTSGIVANSVAQEGYAGKLVFTYDDGVVEDYEQAYQQAHQPEGVPACTAMISSRVNTSNSLSESQLRELQNAGWEIMSHSMTHRALTDVSVIRDVQPGDGRIYVDWNKHGEHPGDTILLSDSNKSEAVVVSGQGNDGTPYITLREPVTQGFSASDTIERYTDDRIRTELRNSRNQLEGYGLDVTDAVMPYGAYGDRTRQIISDYYTAVANAAAGSPGSVNGDKGLNPVDDLNLPNLSRRYFREGRMTYDEIATFLDRVAQEDVLGIFGGHTWWDRSGDDPLPPERIRNTIQMAKERNIEIVTLQQALDDLGYTGDPTTTTTTTQEPTTTETTTTATTTATTTESTTDTTTETSNPTTTTTSTPTTTESTETTATETTTNTTTETTATTTDTTTETTDTTDRTTTDTTTENTTEKTETTDTTTEDTTTEDTTTEDTTAEDTTTEDEPNTPPEAPDTETTTQNNGGGGGGGGGGGFDSTTTTTTTQTPTTTETTTTESPTTMPLADETSTTTETTTETTTTTKTPTPTLTGTPSLTETTQGGGNPGVSVPGFGWLATFGAAGSLAAYALSQSDGEDEE